MYRHTRRDPFCKTSPGRSSTPRKSPTTGCVHLAHPELMVSTGFANPLVDQALSLSTLPVASDAA